MYTSFRRAFRTLSRYHSSVIIKDDSFYYFDEKKRLIRLDITFREIKKKCHYDFIQDQETNGLNIKGITFGFEVMKDKVVMIISNLSLVYLLILDKETLQREDIITFEIDEKIIYIFRCRDKIHLELEGGNDVIVDPISHQIVHRVHHYEDEEEIVGADLNFEEESYLIGWTRNKLNLIEDDAIIFPIVFGTKDGLSLHLMTDHYNILLPPLNVIDDWYNLGDLEQSLSLRTSYDGKNLPANVIIFRHPLVIFESVGGRKWILAKFFNHPYCEIYLINIVVVNKITHQEERHI